MRDVSTKYNTLRTAKAATSLIVQAATIEAIRTGNLPKADPLAVAKVAAMQAAKQTSVIIPYCHQVPLDFVGVDIELKERTIEIVTQVKAIWKTGVEMEALTAASVAALTLYDMLKIIDEEMEIGTVRLLEKTGGKSASRITGESRSAAVIVLSDSVSNGTEEDRSGKLLVEELLKWKFSVKEYLVLPDERDKLEAVLKSFADDMNIDLILTTGGTGMSPRDITPEATNAVIERRLDGVEQALRRYGQDRIPTAMLSRAVAGVRGRTIIVNLPGAQRAAKESIDALFPPLLHAFGVLQGERH